MSDFRGIIKSKLANKLSKSNGDIHSISQNTSVRKNRFIDNLNLLSYEDPMTESLQRKNTESKIKKVQEYSMSPTELKIKKSIENGKFQKY